MNSAKNDNLEPGLGTRNFKIMFRFSNLGKILGYSLGAKLSKLLRFEFFCIPFEKVSLYQIQTISHLQSENLYCIYHVLVASKIYAQQGSEHVKPCDTNLVKMKGTQSKINLHHPVVHPMLIKNGKRTVIWCALTELLECKIHEKCLSPYVSTFKHLFPQWSFKAGTL